MKSNETILRNAVKNFNSIKGIRVGDYVELSDPHRFTRVTETYPDGSFQTGGHEGSQYHLSEEGYTSYSGGLDHGFHISQIKSTKRTKLGYVWIWDMGIAGAGRGVDRQILFRVFKLDYTKFKREWNQMLTSTPKYQYWYANDEVYAILLKGKVPDKNTKWYERYQEAEKKLGLAQTGGIFV